MARVGESGYARADGSRVRWRYTGGRSERRPYEMPSAKAHPSCARLFPER
jgi:hypothetical protein